MSLCMLGLPGCAVAPAYAAPPAIWYPQQAAAIPASMGGSSCMELLTFLSFVLGLIMLREWSCTSGRSGC